MNIEKLETVLSNLTTRELKERYAKCYGHTPTSRNRAHLIKRIIWAYQRDVHGDISDTARTKALAIADDRDIKERFAEDKHPGSGPASATSKSITFNPAPNLLPGSVLHRDYQGKDIRVLVVENGFEWEGTVYKSLSATARAITGTRWNGKLFFGLKKKGGVA